MQLIQALLVLATLIFIHELGHFLTARSFGIKVTRFSLGFGPVLLRHIAGGTEYALRSVPLGGYVSFPDDEAMVEDRSAEDKSADPDRLHNRPVWQRSAVILAGVAVNALAGYLVLVLLFALGGIPQTERLPGVLVGQVAPKSGAEAAGIRAGDVVQRVDGEKLVNPNALGPRVRARAPRPVQLLVERGGQSRIVAVAPDRQGKVGLLLQEHLRTTYREARGHQEVLARAGGLYQQMVALTVDAVRHLVSFKADLSQMAGPVGVIAMTTQAAEEGWRNLVIVGAFVSVNLAIINLLPFPALDGGQLVFVLLEAVRREPVPTAVRQKVSQISFVLLMGLGAALIAKDSLVLLLR